MGDLGGGRLVGMGRPRLGGLGEKGARHWEGGLGPEGGKGWTGMGEKGRRRDGKGERERRTGELLFSSL